jgi:hypothetical protein
LVDSHASFPNVGRRPNDGIYARAIALEVDGVKLIHLAIDAIGSDKGLNDDVLAEAVAKGLKTPPGQVVISGTHSHSGPGAISSDFLWNIAPATDLLVPHVRAAMRDHMVTALLNAEASLVPAKLGFSSTPLLGVTVNRRAHITPGESPTQIDPHLGVLVAVDAKSGDRIGTLWNFAIHGVCYSSDNLLFSGDIAGHANTLLDSSEGGVTVFVNADAGDIDPAPGMCDNGPNFVGSKKMAMAVSAAASAIKPSADGASLAVASTIVDFGPTDMNATLGRFDNCTSGGELDICTICEVLRCDLNVHFNEGWLTNRPPFTAIRLTVSDSTLLAVTMPGEALLELGWWVRNYTEPMADTTFLLGYSQSHMGYFTTPDSYQIGGYESQLTFWGIDTAHKILDGVKAAVTSLP